MPTINVEFEDADWKKISLIRFKSGLYWPNFIIAAADAYEMQERCKDDGK